MACETACGGILKKLGTVCANSEIENEKVSSGLHHMRIRNPKWSVRKLVRDDHEVYIKRWRWHPEHNQKLFEHAGVYYLKLYITPPIDSTKNDSGFGRQAA